jgi:Fic family protein
VRTEAAPKGKDKAPAARPSKLSNGGAPRPSEKRPAAARDARPASRTQRTAAPERTAVVREAPRVVALPIPVLVPPKRMSVEERAASIDQRLNAQSEDFRRRYIDNFDMSWIYHDSALEGVVYTFEELRTALSGQTPPVTDSSLQPTCDDIRRHKEAIDFVRDYATKKRLPVTLDIIKKIYLILRPEEGDIKTVKYRKDVPQHRLYFHEYAAPDKIAYKVRQVVDWLNDPETRKTRNGIRIAARAHYDLLRVYPFPTDSGKVARLFMNLLLLRSGLPPSIIHSTERQRYYEALKGSATTVLQMVQESVENALSSVEKLLDEHETKTRAFVS